MKAIHVVNAPPFADAVIGMMKLAFKSKIAKRVSIVIFPLHDIVAKIYIYFASVYFLPQICYTRIALWYRFS
jgi:hypothetical protein